MTHTKTNTKAKTHTKANAKCFKDPTYVIFLKARGSENSNMTSGEDKDMDMVDTDMADTDIADMDMVDMDMVDIDNDMVDISERT